MSTPSWKEQKPIGIDGDSKIYHYYSRPENSDVEFSETWKILQEAFDMKISDSVSSKLVSQSIISPVHKVSKRFFNYGPTQLVFHVEIISKNNTTLEFCALINQPISSKNLTRMEFQNLKDLEKVDSKNLISPLAFYENTTSTRALYLTPYVNQARCIYFDKKFRKWGVFVPEPYYRFVPFREGLEKKVQECMIAMIVHFYDINTQTGLAATKISGDDFIILKEWSGGSDDVNKGKEEDLLKNMRLIACRGRVKMPIEKYLETLKREFSAGSPITHVIGPPWSYVGNGKESGENEKEKTCYSNEGEFIINLKSGIPIPLEIIKRGIDMGLKPVNFA